MELDPIARRVLAAFDELGEQTLDLYTLAKRAGGATPAERDTVRARLTQLVRQGWLRSAGRWDSFVRSEEGRLAVAGPREATLYTRRGCLLCEEAKALLVPLLREFGGTLREVDVDSDPMLRERYTNEVPVIFLGSRKVAKHRIDLAQFRRQLSEASRSA